ncbi:hypothetical protein [Tsukamurella paurometabola]|uniref:Transmembrane protein n=1 Tax=Tsukamurella paurometabola TaxID=2061 RepID=A0A3P8KFE5_TSUPA|nr:hypothetical protein [Tsukamurella paurometabola]UEA81631.1 hypothetical protein LK411_14630 [Tsukamurella paurometabola]VDR38638.1 Uncharacterised protein [Tsukamurella paurometabola]
MHSSFYGPVSFWKRVLALVVVMTVFAVGVAGIGWAVSIWRADVTCEGMLMREGDTCAYIKTKTYLDEVYTPAGVRPVRRPAQPPGARMHSIQQVHVRDAGGMRADNHRDAFWIGLVCSAATLACGYISFQAARRQLKEVP